MIAELSFCLNYICSSVTRFRKCEAVMLQMALQEQSARECFGARFALLALLSSCCCFRSGVCLCVRRLIGTLLLCAVCAGEASAGAVQCSTVQRESGVTVAHCDASKGAYARGDANTLDRATDTQTAAEMQRRRTTEPPHGTEGNARREGGGAECGMVCIGGEGGWHCDH